MRRFCLIVLTLPALLVTACGGEPSPPNAAPGSPGNPLQALPNPAPTRVPPVSEAGAAPQSSARQSAANSGAARPLSDAQARKRTQARDERERARTKAKAATRAEANAKPAAAPTDAKPSGPPATARAGPRKQKALAPSTQRPCSLVTKAQARAIIGAPILEPLEAPQGPTCIYQSQSGKRFITLTVQTIDFAKLKAQVREGRAVDVSDRSALCGNLGRPMLYLPLDGGRVLSVAGPCDVASRFAAKAVGHL